jgi:cyclopropane-fatty-acyl-phospholipid synthase
LVQELSRQGIHPWGSPEVKQLESRVARFLEREYRRWQRKAVPPDDASVVTDSGPMWAGTTALLEQHYDESLGLFEAFLDHRYMAYTMAYYGDTPEAVRASSRCLEEAQRAKLALIAERSGLAAGARVLSIGCGFGPLETFLGEVFPELAVTAITPSRTQIEFIRARQADPSHPLARAGLDIVHGDFGAVPASQLGKARYDIVFAIGMFEHVNNLHAAFEKIAGLLQPGGRAFIHLIVSRMVLPRFLDAEKTMIGRYFPGGKIWPFDTIAAQTKHLQLENCWFVNGLNYWRTLDAWHRRFWANLPSVFGAYLDSDAVRHWNQYFSLSKACFVPADGSLYGNGHFLFRKSA